MEYARHQAALDAPIRDSKGKSQGSVRSHLESAAKRGNRRAIKRLESAPELPDALAYLWSWACELHGKSGVGMAGYNPLTYTTIAHWSALTGNRPAPHEVQALLWIDAVMLSDGKSEEKQ